MAHISRRSFHARLRPFRNATVALGLVVLALLAPACTESRSSSDNGVASLGGSSDETSGASGTGQKPFEEAGLDYAECMRTNGIDMPDPEPGGGFDINGTKEQDFSEDEFRDADVKCRHFLEDARPPQLSEQEQQQLEEDALAFARCMRDHGIDLPDPWFAEDGSVAIEIGEPGSDLSPDDPDFRAAQRACEDQIAPH